MFFHRQKMETVEEAIVYAKPMTVSETRLDDPSSIWTFFLFKCLKVLSFGFLDRELQPSWK